MDLFGTTVLPGLSTANDLVTPEEERALIAAIDAMDLSPFPLSELGGEAPNGVVRLDL